MTPLHLDYQRSTRSLPWAGGLLLVASLGATMLTGDYYRNLSGKIAYWENKAEQAERTPDQLAAATRQDTVETFKEIRNANEVLKRISLPWDSLFQAVESSADNQVALLEMEPDAEKHVVKISGEAKNIGALLNYIRQLEMQQAFSSVYLQSHQIVQQDPDKPVRFALQAAWRVDQ